MIQSYILTVIPDLPDPIRLTRIGGPAPDCDIPVRGATLTDAADAILTDAGHRLPVQHVAAFAQFAFGGMEGTRLAVTVRGERIARFCEAVNHVNQSTNHGG